MKTLLLTTIVIVIVCGGCGPVTHVGDDSQPDMSAPSQVPAAPKFSEQLVCVVDAHGLGLQHMYRLDMVQRQAEFVGGFGQRIVALRSQAMRVASDNISATFPVSETGNYAQFKVTIQRDDLSYGVEVVKLDEHADARLPARMSGRCSILDGRGFLTVQPEGTQVRQTLKNHDKAMAVATTF